LYRYNPLTRYYSCCKQPGTLLCWLTGLVCVAGVCRQVCQGVAPSCRPKWRHRASVCFCALCDRKNGKQGLGGKGFFLFCFRRLVQMLPSVVSSSSPFVQQHHLKHEPSVAVDRYRLCKRRGSVVVFMNTGRVPCLHACRT
jgi:hypothetical protein